MKKKILILSIAMLLILFGCLKTPSHTSCCEPGEAPDFLTNCTLENGTELLNVYCNPEDSLCYDSEGGDSLNISVCLVPELNSCVKDSCVAMICGDQRYNPSPEMSHCDVINVLNNVSNVSLEGLGKEPHAQNLYQAQCDFLTLSKETYEKMQKANDALWINSFRLGVGHSFSDYNEARLYFPISDKFGTLNTEGWKDRYLNYLNYNASSLCKYDNSEIGWYCTDYSGSTTGDIFNSTELGNLTAKLACENYCANIRGYSLGNCTTTDNHPLFLSSYGGSYHIAHNNYYGYSRCGSDVDGEELEASKFECNEGGSFVGDLWAGLWGADLDGVYYGCVSPFRDEQDPCFVLDEYGFENYWLSDSTIIGWGGKKINEVNIVDYLLYSHQLKSQYGSQLLTGHTDLEGNLHSGMEFECQSDIECYSSSCGKSNYNRFACVNKSNWVHDIDCGVEMNMGTESLEGYFNPKTSVSTWENLFSSGIPECLFECIEDNQENCDNNLIDEDCIDPCIESIEFDECETEWKETCSEEYDEEDCDELCENCYANCWMDIRPYFGEIPVNPINSYFTLSMLESFGVDLLCSSPPSCPPGSTFLTCQEYCGIWAYCYGGESSYGIPPSEEISDCSEFCIGCDSEEMIEEYCELEWEENGYDECIETICDCDSTEPCSQDQVIEYILNNPDSCSDWCVELYTSENIWIEESEDSVLSSTDKEIGELVIFADNPADVELIKQCNILPSGYYIESFGARPMSEILSSNPFCLKQDVTNGFSIWYYDALWDNSKPCKLVAQNRIVITDLGDCNITEDGKVELRNYGWCEPLTEVTLALQEVTKTSNYCPAGVYEADGDLTPYCSLDRTKPCGTGIYPQGDRWWDARCQLCLNGPKEDYYCYNWNDQWPITDPEISYLYQTIETYQKSNIMPILDIKDPELLTDYGGLLSHNVFGDGVSIIIVGNFEDTSSDELYDLAKKVKDSCPLCLTAIQVKGSTTSADEHNIELLDEFFNYDESYGDPRHALDKEKLDAVDIIAMEFYPHEYVSEGYITPEEIIEQKAKFSRKLLERYEKPSLISDFNIQEPTVEEQSAIIEIDLQITERGNSCFTRGWGYDIWHSDCFNFNQDGDVFKCESTSPLINCSLESPLSKVKLFDDDCGAGDTEASVGRGITAKINTSKITQELEGNLTKIEILTVKGEDAIGKWPHTGEDIGKWTINTLPSNIYTNVLPAGEIGQTHGTWEGHTYSKWPVTKPCEGREDPFADCSWGFEWYNDEDNPFPIDFDKKDKEINLDFGLFAGEGDDNENRVISCSDSDWTINSNSRNAKGLIKLKISYTLPVTGYFTDSANIDEFYNYLFSHQRELTDVGIIGLVYRDWKGTTDTNLVFNNIKGNNFCAFQRESKKLLGIETQEMYVKVYAPEEDNCQCIECTEIDHLTGNCNPYCEDGKVCTGYSGSNQKCQLLCAREEQCTLCNETGGDFSCEFYFADGTSTAGQRGFLEDITRYDSDIIANLPNNKKCCLIDENTNTTYTYAEIEGKKYNSELIIYPKYGDPDVDCKGPEAMDYCIDNPLTVKMLHEGGNLICR